MVAPFAALRAWSWKPEAADVLTSLPDMHDMQAESSAPWLSGLNTQHLLMLMSLEILPLLFLLLPLRLHLPHPLRLLSARAR
jgi:hypothetical protein